MSQNTTPAPGPDTKDRVSSSSPMTPSTGHTALRRVVAQLEEHVAQAGWDAPVGLFALVRTAVLQQDPALAPMLGEAALAQARTEPDALTAIEQGDLPPAHGLEELLAGIMWPDDVDGTAVATERIMLPAEAERQAATITDPQERSAFLLARPDRDDIRIVVGVLRSGESWCIVRTRSHDSADETLSGAALVPDLVAALRRTLN